MNGAKFSEAKSARSVASDDMANAIDSWIALYIGNVPWLSKNPQTLSLPANVAAETARLVTLEMGCSISDPDDLQSDDENTQEEDAPESRARFLLNQLSPVINRIRTNCEYACAGGGIVFKPYYDGKGLSIDVVQADAFLPEKFDGDGKMIKVTFPERIQKDNAVYTRMEKHILTNGDDVDDEILALVENPAQYKGRPVYIVINTAFKSHKEDFLGESCALDEVSEWSGLEPVQIIADITSPLFAYFRIPQGNTIDPSSPLGVSVYARAQTLFEDADKQYQRLLWEFEGGELAIDASVDAFKTVDKKPSLPEGKERLFRINDLDPAISSGGELLKAWSPQLREVQLNNGLNRILIAIEDACSLSRGTFSSQVVDARTATEIKLTRQRSYASVSDIQMSLESALRDLIAALDSYATLYNLAPEGRYTVAFRWDDSIIVDAASEREVDRRDVLDGLMGAYEYRMKWYGESKSKAEKAIALIGGMSQSDDEILGFGNAGEAG